MGTLCKISVLQADEALVGSAAAAAFDEMDRLEALMTSWRPDSDVGRVNAAAGKGAVVVAPETLTVIEKALWVARETDGAFDITVGVFSGLWKFDEDNDGSIPRREEVLARRRLVDWRDVIVDHEARTVRLRRAGQKITLGGIAKGFIVDAAVAVLRARGLRDFLVQAGGDFYAAGHRGDRPWNVGIQDPRAPPELPKSAETIFALLPLSDRAFNTSGDYERFILKNGRRYHHILDPRTGYPASAARSVTVYAKDATTADGLDDAILILGVEKGLKLIESIPDAGAIIVDKDNKVHISKRLQPLVKIVHPPSPGI